MDIHRPSLGSQNRINDLLNLLNFHFAEAYYIQLISVEMPIISKIYKNLCLYVFIYIIA